MLDPVSEQIREVYAVFGMAMYQAQNLEKGLAILFAVFDDSKLMTAWDYDARFAESFESTFGTLVAKFAELPSPGHEQLLKQLEKAVNDRNVLAHHYFWDRAAQFCSSEGRTEMIRELVEMGNCFESLDQELGQLARGIAQRRGLTKEVLKAQTAAETEALLSGDARPYRPERVPNPIEIVTAYEWRTDSTVKSKLILGSKDGKYLVLGDRGLCYGPQNIPAEELVVKADFERALPATVNPRPKKSVPWDYGIALANGYTLRARPDEVNGKPVCRFGLHRLKR
jgi:hypothetical protein